MAQASLHRYFASKSDSATASALTGKEPLEDNSRASDASDASTKPAHDACIDEASAQAQQTDSKRSTCPPGICIAQIEQGHINAIKQLTSTTLPMRYSDKFYKQAVSDAAINSLTRVALFDGQPVGWIRCCLEGGGASSTSGHQTPPSQIYIQALCLLGPYRGHGVATQLLDSILRSLPVQEEQRASSIYAHVWEQNEDALGWYERRGFKRVLLLNQYYRRLRPCGAWVVRRELDSL
ncbi:hypothetical protein DV738_g2151, partial [Chaetothyriales sp. CBS 135597]